MNKAYIIGVDIGGTNTDAVLVDEQEQIVAAVKTATTENKNDGFVAAIAPLLKQIHPNTIQGVFLGTTHATNAILQKETLFRVGVIRIAGQRPETLPVAFSWPQELKAAVIGGVETVDGGFECHGRPLTPLRESEVREAVERLLEKGIESIAVVGVFSPLNGEQERLVSRLIKELAGPSFPISLSCEIGGIGFIERENSTILNASLKRVMQEGFRSLQATCERMGLTCPLMITQNDGSLIDLKRAIAYPVLTISAGPTNSFVGAARLAGLEQAVVVDIGGTSTDVGLIRNGFPVRSLNKSKIGGVSLNFPMPDVLSVALGGGSVVRFDSSIPTIGPESVGKALSSRARSFGGSEYTLTDAAIALGYTNIPSSRPFPSMPHACVFDRVKEILDDLIRNIRGEFREFPTLFVGGGAALFPPAFFDKGTTLPPFYDTANAYGAALAEFSGTVDTTVSLKNREEVFQRLYEEAKQKALSQGAKSETLRLVDQQVIPYSYVPNQMARVIVRVCGKRKKSQLSEVMFQNIAPSKNR